MTERNTMDIATLLAEALRTPIQSRAAFLDCACEGKAALRRDLNDLLAAHAQAGDFLQRGAVPTGAIEAPTLAAASHEGVGTRIGPYKLLQLIGEGGFGSVYMADQEQPVRRRVALKIIKLGMDTRQVIARFEAERQALAMMDHPNIARVFDAGATDTGRPFFVMELVHGVPITEYCDKTHLDPRRRLELFTHVCRAVQHAHQKGVIHRDIKPSNVLVTLHDGVPVPKVIDFGIAKAVSQKLTERTLFTEYRQFIGTPEYMSPEQAEMSGLDIDTRSDIYSLGVLLYELLTGVTPFDGKTLRSAAIGEIQRIIREEEPQKPSTRLSHLEATIGHIAAQRGTEPAKLTRVIRGDLDWIVMKALEKDRTRRYDTATSLALDVERYLNDEPVTAGAPGAAYRLRKFVKRNRGPVFAAGLIAAALMLGIAATTSALLVAQQQRDKALDAEQEQARLRRQAERIAEFMQETLEGAGPMLAAGRDSAVLREMMDAAAHRIADGDLRDSPETELQLRITIGGVYREISAFDEAEAMIRPALEIARTLHPGDHQNTAQVLNTMALLRSETQTLDEAVDLSRQAMEMMQRLHGEDHEAVATAMTAYGGMLHRANREQEAERLIRDALAMYERLGVGDHEYVAEGWKRLAALRRQAGDLVAAEPLYRTAYDIQRRVTTGDSPALSALLQSLGLLHFDQGEMDKAEADFRAAMEMNQRLYRTAAGSDHIDIGRNLDALAGVARSRNDLPGALALLEQSLAMRRRLVDGDSMDVASSLRNIAVLKFDLGDPDAAEQLLQESLAIHRRSLPIDHPDTQLTLENLATVMQRRGDAAGSIPLYRELLESRRRSIQGDHPLLTRVLVDLCISLLAEGRAAEAEAPLRECLAMRQRLLDAGTPGQQPWQVANTMSMLAGALLDQAEDASLPLATRLEKLDEAQPLAEDAYHRLEADPQSPRGEPNRVEEARLRADRAKTLHESLSTNSPWDA